jgi:DNA-binding PucR family transcriptional regulator
MKSEDAVRDGLHRLGAVLARDADAMGPQALGYIFEHFDVALRDVAIDAIRDIALAAIRADIAAFAEVLIHDLDADRSQAPLMAIVHARRLARAGVTLDGILRLYRLGQEWLFARMNRIVADELADVDDRGAVLAQAGLTMLRLVDIVSVRVAEEFAAEREAMVRGALARRDGLVRSILAGETIDVEAAERTLAYRLRGEHVAVLCWWRKDPTDARSALQLEEAVRRLAQALRGGRPLILTEDPLATTAWIPGPERAALRRDVLEEPLAAAAPGAQAAFGGVRHGIDGVRDTRREAERARAVALASTREPLCVLYEDVALVGLLGADIEAARRFVRDQLGQLGADGPLEAMLRETVLEVFQAGGSNKVAAHRLHVHRNTIGGRLARAESILGHPLDSGRRELEAALLLAHWLGPNVLAPAAGT